MRVYVVINGSIDSLTLYKNLEYLKVNVIDMIDHTFLYAGHLNNYEVQVVLRECLKYGECSINTYLNT